MIDRKNFKLSIIIPCFNEKNTINIILEKIIQNLNDYKIINYEIIIIDDNSNDGTKELLKNLDHNEKIKIYFHDNNSGKGAAIQTALEYITGDITIIQDADLEYDPTDYEKLLIPFFETNADVVYGSRFLGGGKYVRIHFFWHFLANKILTFICNLFINLNLTDMETGYKVFKSSVLKDISLMKKPFHLSQKLLLNYQKKNVNFMKYQSLIMADHMRKEKKLV